MSALASTTPERGSAAWARARAQRLKLLKNVGIAALIVATLAVMLFPFYWMVLTSLRSQVDNVSRIPVWFFTPTW